MKYAEIKQKPPAEVSDFLATTREELRKARFSVRQKQLKNVRKVRELKKTIAQAMTRLRQSQNS